MICCHKARSTAETDREPALVHQVSYLTSAQNSASCCRKEHSRCVQCASASLSGGVTGAAERTQSATTGFLTRGCQ